MGPKKGKGKDKKDEAPLEESEYAIMDLEMLKVSIYHYFFINNILSLFTGISTYVKTTS